jgi:hypothetical protein
MPKRKSAAPCPATLYAAALYLATRYAGSGCPGVCRMVVQHFELIANHPDPAVPDGLRETCRMLQADWKNIGAAREQLMRKTAVPDAAETVRGPLH